MWVDWESQKLYYKEAYGIDLDKVPVVSEDRWATSTSYLDAAEFLNRVEVIRG